MKKNILIIAALALVGIATLTFDSLRAQNAAAPPPSAQQVPPPGNRPRPMMGPRNRQGMMYQRAVMFLKQVKMELQNSKEDYDGHRQSAMEACDKAVLELEAVQTSIQTAAAKAAAAQQAPATAPAPAPKQ